MNPKQLLDTILSSEFDDGLTREFRFHPVRKWRFDYAYPSRKIAIEFEGGTWVRGGHVRPVIYSQNCEKYNTAAQLGWRVYRFTPDMMRQGTTIDFIRTILTSEV